jgi:hypothetical protein
VVTAKYLYPVLGYRFGISAQYNRLQNRNKFTEQITRERDEVDAYIPRS